MYKLAFLSAIVALSTVGSAQSVWTVSEFGLGVDFTGADALQDAIDFASSGDTLLIAPGDYKAFEIDGKALTLAGDAGDAGTAPVYIGTSSFGMANPLAGDAGDPAAMMRVRNLAVEQSVTLRNLTISLSFGPSPSFMTSLHVKDCAGAVWVEGCELSTYSLFDSGGFGEREVATIQSSASTTLIDCTLRAYRASDALFVSNSNVHSFGGSVEGGASVVAGQLATNATRAGHGAHVESGSLFASGTAFIGADGFPASALGCAGPSVDGGHAIFLDGGTLQSLAVTLTPGQGGDSGACGTPDGVDGSAVFSINGVHVALTGSAHGLHSSSPVFVGETLVQEFSGLPGELAFQSVGFGHAVGSFYPSLGGVLLLTGPQFVRFRGVLDAGGSLVNSIPIQPLGVEGLTAYVQPLFFDVGTQLSSLGSATAVTLVE